MNEDQSAQKNLVVSWDGMHTAAVNLSEKLAQQNWIGIVSITRGGLIPACIVARELNIRLIETLCVHSYDHQHQNNARILKQPSLQDDGKGWVIIDDLVDTGKTFDIARDLYPKAHLACLYAKPAGKPKVDDYVQDVAQTTWIHLPWDLSLQYRKPLVGNE